MVLIEFLLYSDFKVNIITKCASQAVGSNAEYGEALYWSTKLLKLFVIFTWFCRWKFYVRTFIVCLLFHLSRRRVCFKNHTNANIAKVRRGDVINFIVNERFVIWRKAPQKLFGSESFCVLRQPQLRVSPDRPHSGKRNLWKINSSR